MPGTAVGSDALRADPVLFLVFLGVFGAIAGSFASAAIYRIPRAPELSLLRPLRSHCAACQATIRWYDNLPIVSFLLLRGRCRACGVRYGAGYLFHELGLAGLFVAAGLTAPGQAGPLALIAVCIALTALWIAAVVDFQHLILPDGITLGGLAAAVPAVLLVPELHLWADRPDLPWGAGLAVQLGLLEPTAAPRLLALASGAVGAAGAFLLTWAIGGLFGWMLRREALGFGDVKYLAAVGAWTGLEGALWTLLIGVFVGSLAGLANVARVTALVARRRRHRAPRRRYAHSAWTTGYLVGRLIPFGPPLILGTTLVLLAPASVHHFFLVTWPEWMSGASPFALTTSTP